MKKVTVLLTGGAPLALAIPAEVVSIFRACVIDKLVFRHEDTAINCHHVMAYVIEDVSDSSGETEEDGCNS